MILWVVAGAAALYLLSRTKAGAAGTPAPAPSMQAAPAPGTAIIQQAPLPPPVPLLNTSMPPSPTVPVYIPGDPGVAPVVYHTQIAISSAPIGNPAFIPTIDPSSLAAARAASTSINKNLQIAVATNKAGGMYQGYGVPLGGQGAFNQPMFAPLPMDPAGGFDVSSLGIDNGTTWGPVALGSTSPMLDSGTGSGFGL